MADVQYISMFDAYLTNVDNRQRQYAIHKLKHLEKIFRDNGQSDAANTTRSVAAEIVGEMFERLLEIKDQMEGV